MKIAKEGYIIGGKCDRVHKARAKREEGTKYFLAWMKKKNCFSHTRGWYKVVKMLYPPRKEMYRLGGLYGGDFEIGMYRLRQEVMEQLYEKGKAFRWDWMERWVVDIASFEFGCKSESPLSIINPDEKFEWGLCPAHRDDIYQSRKKRGDLKGGN
jgi:hypothetical protein